MKDKPHDEASLGRISFCHKHKLCLQKHISAEEENVTPKTDSEKFYFPVSYENVY